MFRRRKSERNWIASEGSSAFDAFRNVASLLMLGSPGHEVLLITSATAGEGKTVCSGNLAFHLARAGQRVLLVDINLDQPELTRRLGLSEKAGLSDAAAGAGRLSDLAGANRELSVDVVGCGSKDGVVPSAFFMSDNAKAMIREARERYDKVILDASGITVSADFFHLLPEVNRAVFVVGVNVVAKSRLLKARARFDGVWKKETVVIINRYPNPVPAFIDRAMATRI